MVWWDYPDGADPYLVAQLHQARTVLPPWYRWHQTMIGVVGLSLALGCVLLPLPRGTSIALTFILSLCHRALRFTVTRDNPVVATLWHDPAEAWHRTAAEQQRDLEGFLVRLESTYDTPLHLTLIVCGYAALFGVGLWDMHR